MSFRVLYQYRKTLALNRDVLYMLKIYAQNADLNRNTT